MSATATLDDFCETYERDGFVFPIDVISRTEAEAIRADYEQAETELANQPEKLALLRAYPERLLPSFDKLIRHPKMISAASQVLGPDIMVWSAGMFIKEANSPNIVTWHQDLTYWGLDNTDETTCWIALSEASIEAGCMQFVPGSHTADLVPHHDTFDKNNLLTRGQEVSVEVAEEDGVAAPLNTGQASMHHGHLIHSSGPNTTNDRRIGSAIRYIKTSMKQRTDEKMLVSLVSGKDTYGHFHIAEPPKGRLLEEDFNLCRRDVELKRDVIYEGVETGKGKMY